MTTETPRVVYEEMSCQTCSGPLELATPATHHSVEVWCRNCGHQKTVMTTQCLGREGSDNCNVFLFFGGKSGRVPINIATGASHFLDCKFRAKFTRQRPVKVSADASAVLQGKLGE